MASYQKLAIDSFLPLSKHAIWDCFAPSKTIPSQLSISSIFLDLIEVRLFLAWLNMKEAE